MNRKADLSKAFDDYCEEAVCQQLSGRHDSTSSDNKRPRRKAAEAATIRIHNTFVPPGQKTNKKTSFTNTKQIEFESKLKPKNAVKKEKRDTGDMCQDVIEEETSNVPTISAKHATPPKTTTVSEKKPDAVFAVEPEVSISKAFGVTYIVDAPTLSTAIEPEVSISKAFGVTYIVDATTLSTAIEPEVSISKAFGVTYIVDATTLSTAPAADAADSDANAATDTAVDTAAAAATTTTTATVSNPVSADPVAKSTNVDELVDDLVSLDINLCISTSEDTYNAQYAKQITPWVRRRSFVQEPTETSLIYRMFSMRRLTLNLCDLFDSVEDSCEKKPDAVFAVPIAPALVSSSGASKPNHKKTKQPETEPVLLPISTPDSGRILMRAMREKPIADSTGVPRNDNKLVDAAAKRQEYMKERRDKLKEQNEAKAKKCYESRQKMMAEKQEKDDRKKKPDVVTAELAAEPAETAPATPGEFRFLQPKILKKLKAAESKKKETTVPISPSIRTPATTTSTTTTITTTSTSSDENPETACVNSTTIMSPLATAIFKKSITKSGAIEPEVSISKAFGVTYIVDAPTLSTAIEPEVSISKAFGVTYTVDATTLSTAIEPEVSISKAFGVTYTVDATTLSTAPAADAADSDANAATDTAVDTAAAAATTTTTTTATVSNPVSADPVAKSTNVDELVDDLVSLDINLCISTSEDTYNAQYAKQITPWVRRRSFVQEPTETSLIYRMFSMRPLTLNLCDLFDSVEDSSDSSLWEYEPL